MSETKLWNVYHTFDEDGGFGDAVSTDCYICTIRATREEMQELVNKFDKPEVYDTPYAELFDGGCYAQEVIFADSDNMDAIIKEGLAHHCNMHPYETFVFSERNEEEYEE